MCLLCSRHHTEVHLGLWVIQFRDGIPWVQLPTWIDKQRRWARNTHAGDADLTRRLGTQLRLNRPDPHTQPRPQKHRTTGDPSGAEASDAAADTDAPEPRPPSEPGPRL